MQSQRRCSVWNVTGDEALAAAIDIYWQILTAEVEAEGIDETGAFVGELHWMRMMGVC